MKIGMNCNIGNKGITPFLDLSQEEIAITLPYTAIEDCGVRFYATATSNGTAIQVIIKQGTKNHLVKNYNLNNYQTSADIIYLAKGQTLTATAYTGSFNSTNFKYKLK